MRTPSRAWSLTRASSRPWSRVHLHGHGASQPDETSGPVHTDQAPIQLTQMSCGCVTSPQIKRQPTRSNALGGMGTASLGDAATTGALHSSRPEGRRLRPRAWIPEESGQVGPGKNPQTRRRIRGTDGRSRKPPARPGVTHAPRRWGTVSLSF